MHRFADYSYPKVEWSFDYSFWRAMPTSRTNRMGYLHGGSTSVAYNFTNYLGLVADFGGFDNNRLTLFGPTTSQTVNASGSATHIFSARAFLSAANTIASRLTSRRFSVELMPAPLPFPVAAHLQSALRFLRKAHLRKLLARGLT